MCAIWAGGTDHLVWGPEGDDFNVTVLIGDGVPVPQPVEVMHHPTATHELWNHTNLHLMISAERGAAVPWAVSSMHKVMAPQMQWTCELGSTGIAHLGDGLAGSDPDKRHMSSSGCEVSRSESKHTCAEMHVSTRADFGHQHALAQHKSYA